MLKWKSGSIKFSLLFLSDNFSDLLNRWFANVPFTVSLVYSINPYGVDIVASVALKNVLFTFSLQGEERAAPFTTIITSNDT